MRRRVYKLSKILTTRSTPRGDVFYRNASIRVLFALLMAVYEPDFPHWLYLTEYNPGDIRKAAEKFVKGDIASLTWGQVTSKQNFITYSVYSDYTLEEYKGDLWSKNLDNIYWLLNRIAEKYIEASESHAGVYNAYKHGLRMKTGPSVITMRLQDQSRNPTGQRLLAGASQDSFQFLRIEKVDQGKKRPHYIIKHFSPRESFFHICKMPYVPPQNEPSSNSTTIPKDAKWQIIIAI